MKTFLGIGAGPIQTGIFVSGASAAGFDRIVLADVDKDMVSAIGKSGSITVNTAGKDGIKTDTYTNVEIYNPAVESDLKKLIDIASEADVLATALPSTDFYRHLGWVSEAFTLDPERRRYFYAAENSTTAAEELEKAVGDYPATYYLDTVIGKMSKIFTTDESELPPLALGLNRGHLVEEFNTIYTGCAPGIEDMGIAGLYPKSNLGAFEEAKLYGHNATHFLLGTLAAKKGCRYMSEASIYPDLMRSVLVALRDECGEALCRKFAGIDEFFTKENFTAYAVELIERMVSPVLEDSVDRIIRNPERKFGWNDRIIGAIRLCLSQDVFPAELTAGVELPDGMEDNWRQEPGFDQWEAVAVMTALKVGSRFNYAKSDCDHFRNHLGSPEQLLQTRMLTIAEGDGRGDRVIEVNNGSGLCFTVVPDRGMDIVEASYRGLPLTFCAPAGHVNPGRTNYLGTDFLRNWAGGLMTTCGMRHVGPPEDDPDSPLDSHRGLHGRISGQSAEYVGISRKWRGNRYEVELTGTMREAMMFGENLRLERKISTALGDNTIYIEDKVCNVGCYKEYIQMLYHCNFGYPAIAPGTKLVSVDHEVTPRDDEAATGMHRWASIDEAQSGIREQCFFHHIPATLGNWAEMSFVNQTAGLRVTVAYDTTTLPTLLQWKLEETGRYVIGLEPTNATLLGRVKDVADGVAPELPPGESITFKVKLSFSDI